MRLLARFLWVFALAVFPIVGCNEVTDAVQLTVLISEGLPPTPTVAIEGGRLCQADTSNCAVSGADGEASIELPRNERVTWTLDKDGYGSTLTPYVTEFRYPSGLLEPSRDEFGQALEAASGLYAFVLSPAAGSATLLAPAEYRPSCSSAKTTLDQSAHGDSSPIG